MIELLSTKLLIPRPRLNLVPRPRLTGRLNAGLDKDLTLIAAPAGFGKTTLLAEWIPHSPRCVTWLSLDQGDNDPARFWTYVIASIQQISPPIGAGALDLLQSPQSPPITAILTALINDITLFPDLFVTVLEDYHLIEFQPIHQALAFLLDHLPANFHLVLTTRLDPPLPLARLRARDRLSELRANDLRFTAQESADFLANVKGLHLTAPEIAALDARTEGWIAGLQIAALSMQGRQDLPAFIHTFSGNHRHILGYLAEEVLDQQTPDTLSFLLQTSILSRLCGPLCDAVTGAGGGQAMLESLEHANLFLTPLDDQGRWYRYHHLFTDVLQVRLQRTRPDLLPELHRRAAAWHAGQGMLDQAVSHSLAGADYDQAARLIETAAGDMLRRGSSASLISWLDALPDELVRACPRLCLARAWTFHWGPALSLESAERWAQLAMQAASANGLPDPELAGEVASLQTMIAAARSEVERSRQLARQALDSLPLDSPWRSAVAFCLGTAYMETGDMADASRLLGEALRLSQAAGVHYVQFAVASFLADIQVSQGHLSRAMEMYRQVLDWAGPGAPHKGVVMAHAGLASILWERGQLEAALAHLHAGAEQLDQVGGAWAAFVLDRVLARVRQAQGNWDEALDLLDHARQRGHATQVSLVETQSDALRARLHLAQGDLRSASAWATASGLSPNDAQIDHPGWRELGYLSLARVLAAQGGLAEALSLIDRLLASAEAQERFGSLIEILIFQSMLLHAQGNLLHALANLERALALAEPEGYIRLFVEEGEPMRLLLAAYQSQLKHELTGSVDPATLRLLTYTDNLLAAFSPTASPVESLPLALPEPLSQRELDILRLIASGRTNQEIAEILVIALSTVKSHINNLYAKLGAGRRTQAILIARDLGLLSD